MLFDSIQLVEGSAVTNLVIASGTSYPSLPDLGELFFRTDLDSLQIYDGTGWQQVGPNNVLLSTGGTMTGALTLASDPSSALQAATKQYVDNFVSGLTFKNAVRMATTVDVILSGLQVIDGVTQASGERILVKNQTVASQNGIYNCSAGAWTRSSDADNTPLGEVVAGMFVFVTEGSLAGDTGWVLTTNNPISLGSTGLTFVQFSAGNAVPTLTSTQIGYGSASNVLTGTANLTWDNTTNKLTIGTGLVTNSTLTAPNTLTIVAGNNPGSNPAGSLYLKGGDGVALGSGISGGGVYIMAGNGHPSGMTAADVTIQGGSATNNAGFGNVNINGGTQYGTGYTGGGSLIFSTAPTTTLIERLRILNTGAWSIGTGGAAYGTSGQVLTSNGNAAPTWQTPSSASVSANNTWTAAQRGVVTALTYASTITPNFALSNNYSLTATGNFTMAFPTNVVAGQSGMIAITQDATGSRVVTWASGWVAAGGTKPVLTTAANAVDYISYYVETTGRIFISMIADVK
jgi:hypothetical protein